MFRDLIISCVGHSVMIISLLFVSTFGEKPKVRSFDVYRVKTVSSQSISNLLQRAQAVDERKSKVPQIQTKSQVLPQQHRKKSQTVKRSSTSPSKPGTSKSGNTVPKGMRVDTQFDFPEYLFDIRDKIERNWRPPSSNEQFKTVVFFRIRKDGKITRAFVEKSSGNMVFDLGCQRAVTGTDPFPPLPKEYQNDNLGVHLEFIFTND